MNSNSNGTPLDLITDQAEYPFIDSAWLSQRDCCYAVGGMLQDQGRYTLLRNQIVPFCCPRTGWINSDIEFLLLVLAGGIKIIHVENAPPTARFEAATVGQTVSGNASLHADSCGYAFRPDSIAGFFGNNARRIYPLNCNDVRPLLVADAYEGAVGDASTGTVVAVHPKFYIESAAGVSRYDVDAGIWRQVQEFDMLRTLLFGGSATEGLMLDLEHQLRRSRPSVGMVYVGTDTMNAGSESDYTVLHDTAQGFDIIEASGIRPHLSFVPRYLESTHEGLIRSLGF